MRREVDVTLGIIIKKIVMGKYSTGEKEEENIKADLAKGYKFWEQVYSVICNKNSNNNE